MSVGSHRDTDTGAADKDAALGFTAKHAFSCFMCEVGVIRALSGIGAVINNFISLCAKIFLHPLFVSEPCVI